MDQLSEFPILLQGWTNSFKPEDLGNSASSGCARARARALRALRARASRAAQRRPLAVSGEAEQAPSRALSGLAVMVLEVLSLKLGFYLLDGPKVSFLDFVCYSGYKYVGIVLSSLSYILIGRSAHYLVRTPCPPPPRTNWTRRIPHPVLIGHTASLRVRAGGGRGLQPQGRRRHERAAGAPAPRLPRAHTVRPGADRRSTLRGPPPLPWY